jgi:general secretion pathway protein G
VITMNTAKHNKLKSNKVAKQAGFTLIEIMVVVAVIGLLIGFIGPRVFNQVEKAERTRIAQDIRAIESALKLYRLDNYRYPTQAEGLEALITSPAKNGNWNGPYMENMPTDPWNQPYRYANPSTHNKQVDVFTLGLDNIQGGEGSNKDWGNWNIK